MSRILLSLVLCLFACSQAARPKPGSGSNAVIQQEYEWAKCGKLAQYAQNSFFSLFAFTIPAHAQKAEFKVTSVKFTSGDVKRKVIMSLRRAGIPVLGVYNETVPQTFILPSDQQTFYQNNNVTISTLTLSSPTPGRVYMVASVLNPLVDVINYLRWGDKLKGDWLINVTAIYTLRATVTSLPVDDVSKINSEGNQKKIYSFRVPAFTMSYSVMVSNCQQNRSRRTNCNVTMMTADSLAAGDKSSISVDCRFQGSQCILTKSSPLVQHDHYITFVFNDSRHTQNTTFDISFIIQGCTVAATQYFTTINVPDNWSKMRLDHNDLVSADRHTFINNTLSHEVGTITPDVYRNMTGLLNLLPMSSSVTQYPACTNLGHLGRNSLPNDDGSFRFNTTFGMWTTEGDFVPEFDIIVPDFNTEVRTFNLEDSLDTGGILYITAELMEKDWQGIVWVCAMANRIAKNGSVAECLDGALFELNASLAGNAQDQRISSHAYLPFPTTGSWYLAMQSQCWDNRGPKPCILLPMVQLSVSITQCAPNQCGAYGECQLYMDATTVFAVCQCFAGYRGLTCEDNTYSLTDHEQLRAVYLLTLSNFAFVPAICLALYRRYFTLVAIFFFNAFFSAFYHACDTSPVFQLCIMKYSTLAFCDFFGSVLSFYAVLLTMARIGESLRTFLLMSGALVISVLQNIDRHNDVAHILPLAVAGVVLLVSWARVMRLRRKLFPSKRRYLCYLLPGVLLAVIGIGVNYGLMWHHASYQYTHSFWHVSLMIAPCLFMPPRPKAKITGLSISAQDVIRTSVQDNDEGPPTMFDASMNSLTSDQNLLV